jgi:hypothetical protein
MTHPDFRALCAELLCAYKCSIDHSSQAQEKLIKKADALLAAPQQGAPSDRIRQIAAEVEKCALSWDSSARLLGNVTAEDVADLCDTVLARYGAQVVPVAVAERLPGKEDCDAEGRCWWWAPKHPECPNTGHDSWALYSGACIEDTHWLPHWALPLPEAQP